jgi:hypothetical protein
MSHIHSTGVADAASSCNRPVTNHPSLMNLYLNPTAFRKTFMPKIYFLSRLVQVALGKEFKYAMGTVFARF